jgi:hypothetical protein
MNTRDDMMAEVKSRIVPELRELGFKGSVPHLYRERAKHVDLLCLQFSSAGGSFVLELSYADPNRENIYIDKELPPNKLRVSQATRRLRLGAETESHDFWFAYEGKRPFGITGDPEELATKVVALLHSQAVPWWNDRQAECT